MFQEIKKQNQGFTLLEFVLYMTIATALVAGISGASIQVLQTANKTKLLHEVAYASVFVLDTMARVSAGAYAIQDPLTASSSVTFTMYDAAVNPTRIFEEDETIFIQEGAGSPRPLHTSSTKSAITFTNVTSASAPDSVLISLHASATTHSVLPSFNVAEDFQTTITLNHTP